MEEHQRSRRGFTLIELIVVVLVIGILASIAVPKLFLTRERGYRVSIMADLKSLATVQELYHMDNFVYSSSLGDLGMTESAGVTISINEADASGWSATATHPGVPGRQCGVFHGDADPAGGAPATVPGVVTCDFDG